MSCIKNYLLTVLQHCSEEHFAQEAVEWAIMQGHIKLTYKLADDLTHIFTPNAEGNTPYDLAIEGYQQECRQQYPQQWGRIVRLSELPKYAGSIGASPVPGVAPAPVPEAPNPYANS